MIGKALKYMRKNQNLKQDNLAKSLNISQQNLSRYEMNKELFHLILLKKLQMFVVMKYIL